jgi:hypothetical protein
VKTMRRRRRIRCLSDWWNNFFNVDSKTVYMKENLPQTKTLLNTNTNKGHLNSIVKNGVSSIRMLSVQTDQIPSRRLINIRLLRIICRFTETASGTYESNPHPAQHTRWRSKYTCIVTGHARFSCCVVLKSTIQVQVPINK